MRGAVNITRVSPCPLSPGMNGQHRTPLSDLGPGGSAGPDPGGPREEKMGVRLQKEEGPSSSKAQAQSTLKRTYTCAREGEAGASPTEKKTKT